MKTLRKRWHYIKTWRLAYPVMLSQFGQVMVGQADSIMVGRLGTIPLAAATLAVSIFVVLMIFGIGANYALSPLIANADGEKDYGRIAKVLQHGFILSFALSVILSVILGVISLFLDQMGQDPEVATAAKEYLFYLNATMVPMMLFFTLRQFAEGLSSTKPAMVITLIGNAVNIGLNYVLIYGEFGFPAMGLNGAGLATLVSRWVMLAAMLGLVMSQEPFKSYWKAIVWNTWDKHIAKRLVDVGLPTGLQMIFEVGAFAFAALMTGWISPQAQAAHNVAISLASVSYMIASGLAAAATVRVGNQLGRKDFRNLMEAAKTSLVLAVIVMMAFGVVFLVGKDWLPTLYIQEPEVIGIASSLLIIAVMFQLSDGVQAVGLAALRGLTDVRIPTGITFIAYWVIALPLAYVLGITLDMKAEGIWYGLAIGLTVSAIALGFRFNKRVKELSLEANQRG